MNRPRHLAKIIALSCALQPPGAHAQENQQQENWGAPEIVEVQAKPGHAVWHPATGGSKVWILYSVGARPDRLKWNTDYLAELLDGARAIVMPPRPSIALFEGASFR